MNLGHPNNFYLTIDSCGRKQGLRGGPVWKLDGYVEDGVREVVGYRDATGLNHKLSG